MSTLINEMQTSEDSLDSLYLLFNEKKISLEVHFKALMAYSIEGSFTCHTCCDIPGAWFINCLHVKSPMYCDVIWFLSNKLCVFLFQAIFEEKKTHINCHTSWIKIIYHITKHWRFFLSHIYHPSFILWTVWSYKEITEWGNKNISHYRYHIGINFN
jgi:hypothetical protein